MNFIKLNSHQKSQQVMSVSLISHIKFLLSFKYKYLKANFGQTSLKVHLSFQTDTALRIVNRERKYITPVRMTDNSFQNSILFEVFFYSQVLSLR